MDFLMLRNIHIGQNTNVVSAPRGLMIAGKRANNGSIFIGDNVLFGPDVMLIATNHYYKDKNRTVEGQGHTALPIHIGNDVWLGARVTVLYGSVIPDGCVIGACSIVTRNEKLEPYTVYAGNPLRKIGKRE